MILKIGPLQLVNVLDPCPAHGAVRPHIEGADKATVTKEVATAERQELVP